MLTHITSYHGKEVGVTAGWDKPIRGYFMTVRPAHEVDEQILGVDPNTGLIYSNLSDTVIPFPGLTPDLDHYRNVLIAMGISVPALFWDRVRAERNLE